MLDGVFAGRISISQIRRHKMTWKRVLPWTLISPCKAMGAMIALMVAVLPIAGVQADLHAQEAAPAYVELGAEQLDQLVAPIALSPDSLVGQVLTASTYPDQIGAADAWLKQNMGLPPDERASAVDGMPWDPAVKALTAFPSVLNNLAQNNAWTSQLGNAYYNQPGDVMNAVQALRLQAQESNKLVTTAQQRVVVEAGAIEILPVSPAVVCVPYYNPWVVWGPMFGAYPGFVVMAPPPGVVVGVGIAFFPGISIGIYGGFDWGFAAWAPVWGDGAVFFHNSTYISHSVTVVNHGHFGGHDRGAFEHGGRGVPAGYHATAHAGAARTAAASSHARRGGSGVGNAHTGTGSRAQARNNFSSQASSGAQARNSFSSARTGSGSQARSNFSSRSSSGAQARNSFSSARTGGGAGMGGGAQARGNFSSRSGSGAQARNNFSSARTGGGTRVGGGAQARSNFSTRSGGGLQARNNSSPARMGSGGARMGGGGGGARMGGGGGRRR
jgi:uncharacterized protein DUF3300